MNTSKILKILDFKKMHKLSEVDFPNNVKVAVMPALVE